MFRTFSTSDRTTIASLTAEVDQWKRADAAKAEQLEVTIRRAEMLQRDLSFSTSRFEECRCERARKADELAIAYKELQRLQTRIDRYEEQSRDLKSQLDDVRRFVATADTHADTTIIQMLQKLNEEVQENTTFMAECVLEGFGPRATQPTEEQSSAAQRVSESIGKTLTSYLGSKECDDLALYLSIAFQAYLTYYLHSVISSWTIKKDCNEFINEIYERLLKSEEQTISGRWRSLTRSYISPPCTSDPDALTSVIVAGLSDIVVAAGCATSLSTARLKISSQFGDKVASIISSAGQLSKMIGEVMSIDFEVFVVRPVQMFEATTMEEDFGDPRGTATGQKVLCTARLGMTKRVQLESGDKDRLTVIKAKVVLESFLDD